MLLKLIIFLLLFPSALMAQNAKPLIATDNSTQTCNTTRMIFSPGSLSCSGSVATVTSGSGGSGNVGIGTAGEPAYYPVDGTTVGPFTNVHYVGSNVGIGSTSPGQTLDVNGFIRSTSLTGSKCVQTDATGTLTSAAVACGSGGSSAAGGLNAVQYNSPIGTFAGTENRFSFNGTNVGIGTTNAILAALEVWGNIYTNGNVGIGSITPGAGLDVQGNIRASGTLGGSNFSGTSSGTNTGDQTTVSGNAGTVTVADAGGDTTTWPLLGTSQTGSLAPATDGSLTYNATTHAMTTTTFVGALTGTASGNLVSGGALGTPSSGTATNITGLPEGGLSLTDITTNDVSTSKHGFAPKLDNTATHFLNGQGGYTTPGGSSQWLTTASVGIGTYDRVGIGTTSTQAGFGLVVTNGNVGIGTWTPAALLEVGSAGVRMTQAGMTRLNGTTVAVDNTQLALSTNGVMAVRNSSNGASASTTITGGANAASGVLIQTTSVTGNGGAITFKVGNVGIGTLTAVSIIDGGNVGINTATPFATLEVKGIIRTIGAQTSPITKKSSANQACDTTCTGSMCIYAEDTGVIGTALTCADATADVCLCLGP